MKAALSATVGNMALAKISQASQGRLEELNRQYAHAKRRIGNIPILDPCEAKFKFISEIASALDVLRFNARKLKRMDPLAHETKEKLAQMDTEAKGLREELDDALDDLADAVSDLLGAMEGISEPQGMAHSRSLPERPRDSEAEIAAESEPTQPSRDRRSRSRSRSWSRERKGHGSNGARGS